MNEVSMYIRLILTRAVPFSIKQCRNSIIRKSFNVMRTLLLVLCTALLSCDSGLAVQVTYNDTVISNPLDYCFVNNNTVREKTDSKAQQTIVEDDGDWIVINNGTTDLLLLSTNITDCEVYNPNIIVYAAQVIIDCVIILAAVCTIILHLFFKTLRNDFGVLVMTMSFFVLMLHICTLTLNQYQFMYKVNNRKFICAVLEHSRITLLIIYHTTTVMIHFHFVFLMYNTHKLRPVESDISASLLCKYFTFICLLTTSIMSPIITSDVMFSKIFFATEEGYCAIKFGKDNITFQILSVVLPLMVVAQILMFGIGMTLYLMANKSSCELKRTDVKVCLALVSTAGLSGVLFIISFFLSKDHSTSVPLLLASIGAVMEQLLLLITLCKKAITSNDIKIGSCKNSCLQECVHIKNDLCKINVLP